MLSFQLTFLIVEAGVGADLKLKPSVFVGKLFHELCISFRKARSEYRLNELILFSISTWFIRVEKIYAIFFSSPFGNQSFSPASFTIEPFGGEVTFLLLSVWSFGNGFVLFSAFKAYCFLYRSRQNVLNEEGVVWTGFAVKRLLRKVVVGP